MKKKFYKLISLLLVMALLLPFGGEAFKAVNITAYAEEDLDEASCEAIEDYESVLEYKAGDWGKAVFKDGLAWNHFHNAVQNDIREKNKDQIEADELSVIKPNGKPGRVDLWRIEKKQKTAYYWEVKPGSYLQLDKYIKARSQLQTYLNSKPNSTNPNSKLIENAKVGDNSIIGNRISLNQVLIEMNYNDTFDTDLEFDYFFDKSGYIVIYAYLKDGVILYWFRKLEVDLPEPDFYLDPSLFRNLFLNLGAFFAGKSLEEFMKGFPPTGGVPTEKPQPAYHISQKEAIGIVVSFIAVCGVAAIAYNWTSLKGKITEIAGYIMSGHWQDAALALNVILPNVNITDEELKAHTCNLAGVENLEDIQPGMITEGYEKQYGDIDNAYEWLKEQAKKEKLSSQNNKNSSSKKDDGKNSSNGDKNSSSRRSSSVSSRNTSSSSSRRSSSSSGRNSSTGSSSRTSSSNNDTSSQPNNTSSQPNDTSSYTDPSSSPNDPSENPERPWWLLPLIIPALGPLWGTTFFIMGSTDPIMLDLDGDGYNITNLKEGTYFDLNSDGFAEKINWSTQDGILAVDKNNNGLIDDGTELFSDYFVLNNGEKATNGFEALSQYDTNGNNRIDNEDNSFSDLLVWRDKNGNGISEKSELYSLDELGIEFIDLSFKSVNLDTESGVLIGEESFFVKKDGTENKIGEMWFSADLTDTLEKFALTPSETVSGLPNVRSIGNINSLHTAIMMDETGRLQNLVEQFVNETDIIKRRELVEKILSVICDVEGIKKYSRGPNIDASHLAILEKAFGEKFIGTNGANPNINAANVLNYIYEKIVDLYYCSMLGSLIYDHLQYIDTYVDDNNNVLFDLTLMNQKILYELKNEEISIHQFKDICSYIQILGWAVEDNGNMYHELRQFFKENADHYMDIIDNSVIDAFYGTEDDDNINSNIYSSVMIGKEGNDKLNAKSGNDYLIGNEGDDYLYGGDGNDILDGGTGDDVLKGCAGDDMYIFDLGSGQDIINEGGFKESTKDKVVFGKGLDPKDLIVSKDGNDMILSFKGIDDTVKIVSQYYKKNFQIETYEFIDGTILTIDDLLNTPVHIHGEGSISDNQTVFGTKSNYLHGSEKDDTINAYSGDDHIYGYGGNDVLNGADGNDVLDGGTGDDKLNGSSGDDTYIFKTGYGQDTINEGNSKSANDKVIFGEGISPDDIIVSRDSMDMILSVKDTEDSLRVYYAYYKDSYWIENYEFADGTIITGEEMMYGSEKDDTIYAYSGNDVLDGGKGDDILYGSSGDDTYIFNLGYGNDTINEESNKSTNDKVIFGKGITPDDIVVSRDGWDMILSIKDTEDSLRVYYAYYKDSYWIENYEFADGTIITGEEMEKK